MKSRRTKLSGYCTESSDEKGNIIDIKHVLLLGEDEESLYISHVRTTEVGDSGSSRLEVLHEFKSVEELKKFRDSITNFIRGTNANP
jgi:hypothetical protein